MMLFILSISCLIVLVHAKEYINETKVSWEKARKSCSLPEYYMLASIHDAGDETGFYAWTATTELSSDWAFFQGCIDIGLPREDKQRLSDYFANTNLSFIAIRDDVFKCAFHCTNLNYFVYYMRLCLCITSIDNYPVTDNTGCITTCQDDSVFCSSGFGIPLYKYQPDRRIVRSSMYEYSYHCLSEKDGYNLDENCYSGSNYFKCNEKDIIDLHTNWKNAVNYCTSLNTTLSKSVGYLSAGVWSKYFRYKSFPQDTGTNNEKRKCVAVFINRNKKTNIDPLKWSHFQYRNCSELLPFICVGDINMSSNITSVTREHINTNATDISTTQITSNYSEKIEIDVIVKVNIVLLTLSIVMIVLFSVRVCCKKKTDPK